MVEQIEYPLFSSPCDVINNWYNNKCKFSNVAATLRSHEISNMTAQTRREIDNEVKSLLSGSGSNNRREAGELKALRALKLGDPEEAKKVKILYPP